MVKTVKGIYDFCNRFKVNMALLSRSLVNLDGGANRVLQADSGLFQGARLGLMGLKPIRGQLTCYSMKFPRS